MWHITYIYMYRKERKRKDKRKNTFKHRYFSTILLFHTFPQTSCSVLSWCWFKVVSRRRVRLMWRPLQHTGSSIFRFRRTSATKCWPSWWMGRCLERLESLVLWNCRHFWFATWWSVFVAGAVLQMAQALSSWQVLQGPRRKSARNLVKTSYITCLLFVARADSNMCSCNPLVTSCVSDHSRCGEILSRRTCTAILPGDLFKILCKDLL